MALPIARTVTNTVVASAARTTSDSSASLDYQAASELRVQLDVTAASGTSPTLDVLIEDSLDGTNWNTVGTFAQATGSTREVINISSTFGPEVRITWTIGGTSPSFTFSVDVHAKA